MNNSHSTILLIEDDVLFASLLKKYLERHYFDVSAASTLKQGLDLLNSKVFDCCICDFRLPDGNGLDFLKHVNANNPDLPVLIMTGYSDIKLAVQSIKLGAKDYITKPVNQDELLQSLKELTNFKTSSSKNTQTAGTQHYIYGTSAASKKLTEHIALVAGSNLSVMILGESGTGKEFVAKLIHEKSKRSNAPFVALDCGALTDELAASELFGHVKGSFTGAINDKKGVFEQADGGTLFLDEIGNLSYEIQVMLLRVLQEKLIRRIGDEKSKQIDVRLIVATNENLRDNTTNGSFRADLFHRLNEFSFKLPPLRERKEDIPSFIKHFLSISNEELERSVSEIPEEMMNFFLSYSWPGNLREMKNCIKRAVLLSSGSRLSWEGIQDEMKVENNSILPPSENKTTISDKEFAISSDNNNLKQLIDQEEKLLIQKVLSEVKYNKSEAAKRLNIDRKTLYSRIKRFGL